MRLRSFVVSIFAASSLAGCVSTDSGSKTYVNESGMQVDGAVFDKFDPNEYSRHTAKTVKIGGHEAIVQIGVKYRAITTHSKAPAGMTYNKILAAMAMAEAGPQIQAYCSKGEKATLVQGLAMVAPEFFYAGWACIKAGENPGTVYMESLSRSAQDSLERHRKEVDRKDKAASAPSAVQPKPL